jgi:hypothetical protein
MAYRIIRATLVTSLLFRLLGLSCASASGATSRISPWAETLLEMSFRTYGPDKGRVPEDWRPVSINDTLLKRCNSSGCYPTLYYNKTWDQAVLAFRGTKILDGSDLAAAVGMGFFVTPNLVAAQEVASYAASRYPSIVFTGHSKGGMEATYAAASLDRKALVFSSPGFRRIGDDFLKKYDDNVINVYMSGDGFVGLGQGLGLVQSKGNLELANGERHNGDGVGRHLDKEGLRQGLHLLTDDKVEKINSLFGYTDTRWAQRRRGYNELHRRSVEP